MRREVFLFFLLLQAKVAAYGYDDFMFSAENPPTCYKSTVVNYDSEILVKKFTNTEADCKKGCTDDTKCLAYTALESNGQYHCVLLGGRKQDVCALNVTINVKIGACERCGFIIPLEPVQSVGSPPFLQSTIGEGGITLDPGFLTTKLVRLNFDVRCKGYMEQVSGPLITLTGTGVYQDIPVNGVNKIVIY